MTFLIEVQLSRSQPPELAPSEKLILLDLLLRIGLSHTWCRPLTAVLPDLFLGDTATFGMKDVTPRLR